MFSPANKKIIPEKDLLYTLHRILFKGDEVEATMATVEDAKCRPGDRIKIVITDLMDDVIVQGQENIVSFYKNDKLVCFF